MERFGKRTKQEQPSIKGEERFIFSFPAPDGGPLIPLSTAKQLFFFCRFFSPLYFFVRLPAPRRPFSFPTSAKEQGPKFRVVVCRFRAFGNAPPLRFSQVVWMFPPPLPWPSTPSPNPQPSQAFLALLWFGLWSVSEVVCYHEGCRRD